MLSKDMDGDFVKSRDPGRKGAVLFEFLHSAFAVSRTHNQRVIIEFVWLPIKAPERPC